MGLVALFASASSVVQIQLMTNTYILMALRACLASTEDSSLWGRSRSATSPHRFITPAITKRSEKDGNILQIFGAPALMAFQSTIFMSAVNDAKFLRAESVLARHFAHLLLLTWRRRKVDRTHRWTECTSAADSSAPRPNLCSGEDEEGTGLMQHANYQ